MKIKPLGTRVLIKIKEIETKTASGLFIPQTAQEKTNQGVVIDRGETETLKDYDTVIYDKYAGTNIKIDGEDHLIIEIKDIIAIVQE